MTTPLTTDHSRAVLEDPHARWGSNNEAPHASRAERPCSFAVADFPMPTGREEEWRFSALEAIRPALAAEVIGEQGAKIEVTAPAAYIAKPLAPGEGVRGSVLVPQDRAAAVASALTHEAIHLRVPAETSVSQPMRIAIHGKPGERSTAHHVIEFGAGSCATLVIEHYGGGYHAGNLEVIVGENAQVTVVSLQLWDDDGVHVGQHEARVGPGASYKHVAVSLGGKAVRLAVNASYEGEGGTAKLLGLYFADAGQHLEHQTYIDHNMPGGVSRVTYKGALQGAGARSVWIGDVLIRVEAEGIDTYELNRNLVLTDGARADSVPNLEIETGQIEGAGHASATGRFDDEQLFYLRSRGIPELAARRLVVRGFFAELIGQIGVSDVETRVMDAIETELEASMALAVPAVEA